MHRHIGIYPGTFNPVHEGHVAFALEAKRLLSLDKVVFLPEQRPRLKQNVANIAHRHELLRAAIDNDPSLDSMALSSSRFTVKDTLPELHRLFPRHKMVFLMGSDVAIHLPKWENLSLLIADVTFLIALREGDSQIAIERVFQKLVGPLDAPIRYTFIDSPRPDLASSQIRKKTNSR